MNVIQHTKFLWLLLFFTPIMVCAQDEVIEKTDTTTQPKLVVTLEDLISKTLEISPQISSGQYSLEEAQANYARASRAGILPKVDFSVYGGVVPDTPDNIGPDFNFPSSGLFDNDSWGPFIRMKLEAIQPIYTFGKISNLKKAASMGVLAGQEDITRARNEMIKKKKKAYYTLANLYSYLDFVEDLIGRAQKAVDIVQDKLEKRSSEVTDIDLMRIEVFQSETKRKKIEIEHNIEFVQMTLKILMGLPRETPVDIVDHR
ncbi:MAG: TolC family protein, partial [Deltaproteobacteria bacterium]|nr:TolC family protein [Deltaproteobacteria bacterium]